MTNSKENIENVIDLTEILKGLEGKWVVISDDNKKVLRVADKFADLLGKTEGGSVMQVPSPKYGFASGCIS